jgi:hypothetical protein
LVPLISAICLIACFLGWETVLPVEMATMYAHLFKFLVAQILCCKW